MAMQRCWILRWVAGNPAMSTRVRTEECTPCRRGVTLKAAEKVAANGWRVWVEHAVTAERIFESEAEKAYRQAAEAST